MDAADHIIMIGQQARMIQNITTSRQAKKLARLAVNHATGALMSHNNGEFDGANLRLETAAGYLRDAARIHAGTLEGETPSPEVLDSAHLGGAQKHHQDYVDVINKGKNNGR